MAPSAVSTIETSYTYVSPAKYSNGVHLDLKVDVCPKTLIGDALQKRVESIDHDACNAGEEDAFFVADLGDVYRQHMRFKKYLPRVKPFYAVKCNPDPMVLRLLKALGTGFDCASKAEIQQVLEMGTEPSRIIYAQPCKTNSYVSYAAANGVKQMTFDNTDELYKIKKFFPDAELFIRIVTDDTSSLCRFSMKFGASLDSTKELLTVARELGLNVVGVSFHVGSGAGDPLAFLKAVRDARTVMDQAETFGYKMHTVDVGGGFSSENFEAMAVVLSDALEQYVPAHVNVIAEPGRYYVSSAFTLACNIIARRTVPCPTTGEKSYMIYLNDGVYGNFSSIMFDHQNPIAQVLRTGARSIHNDASASKTDDGIEYSIFGPTCDGIDHITKSIRFDHTLDVGDWLYFEDMGAYTKCSATRFNGFTDAHDVIYVSSEAGAKALLGMA